MPAISEGNLFALHENTADITVAVDGGEEVDVDRSDLRVDMIVELFQEIATSGVVVGGDGLSEAVVGGSGSGELFREEAPENLELEVGLCSRVGFIQGIQNMSGCAIPRDYRLVETKGFIELTG